MAELIRVRCNDRDEWLKARQHQGIGASQAAACIGQSKWLSPIELWKELRGITKSPDLSKNAAVEQGIRLEPAIRTLFQAEHPEFNIEYYAYDLLYQSDRPHAFATLDGEIVHPNGDRSILEIKTSTPNGVAGWDSWKDQVPVNYFWQVMHQMLATGFNSAYLYAMLFTRSGDKIIREYYFERSDFLNELKYLKEEEDKFYKSVVDGTMPSTKLTI